MQPWLPHERQKQQRLEMETVMARDKLLPKPPNFAPADRDQEVLQWHDWYWCFKQYLVVVNEKYEKDLEEVLKAPSTEVDWDLLDASEQQRGRFFYGLLGSLLQGRLLGLVKNVLNSNGLEAMRQLIQNCQPMARNRTMSLLQGIMSYPSFNMKNSILPQIVKLEEHFMVYERLGGKLADEMKAAVLLRSISGPLKVHLNLAVNEGSSYAQIRGAIMSYDVATTKWNESASLQYVTPGQDSTGLAPMEVDRVKGKGKEKGKGWKRKRKRVW